MSEQTDDRLAQWVSALASRARLSRFVSVGIVGAICDAVVLVVLVEWFGVLEELAALAGIEASILLMFALNEGWTFRTVGRRGWRPTLRRLRRSHAVRAGGIVVQFLVFVAVYRLLSVSIRAAGIDLWLLVAKGTGILLGMVLNYVLETLFTWRVQSE